MFKKNFGIKLIHHKKYKLDLIYRWFDIWIGIFIDEANSTYYIFLIPFIGFRLKLLIE